MAAVLGAALRPALDELRRRAARAWHGDELTRPDGDCRQAPEWLVLVVNNACNLHCRMCDVGLGASESVFYRHLIGQKRRNLPLELMERILAQAARFAPRPRVGLAYTEPLLHPQILELCAATSRRGFFCALTTNGYRLPELADGLVEAGLGQLTVSVDGPAEVHDRVRGKPGSFERIRIGLERLRRQRRALGRRRPRVFLSFTLTDLSSGHLGEFARQVEELEPDAVNVSHPNFISAGMAAAHNAAHPDLAVAVSNLGTMDLAGQDFEALAAELALLKRWAARPGRPPLTIVPDLAGPEALAAYYREPLAFVGARRCSDPWRMLMIKTDGTVIPAHGRCYDVPVGNVLERPLLELWNEAPLRDFRRRLRAAGGTLPACARCCGVIGKSVEPGS
jgi:MoaA/NifB/PqqE/SkfB family radical SAM enzyme